MLKKRWLWQGLAFVVAAGGTLIYRSSLCNSIFGCGCQSALAAAGKFCNIHDMAAMAHCPWCSHGSWGHNLPTGSILAAQALILFVPMKLPVAARFVLSVVAFFVVGAAIGLLFGLFSHYPVFLGMRIF